MRWRETSWAALAGLALSVGGVGGAGCTSGSGDASGAGATEGDSQDDDAAGGDDEGMPDGGASSEGGDDEGQDSGDSPLPDAACDDLGRSPLRRISSTQYQQILQDLLPGEFAEAALAVSQFPKTDVDQGFSTYATANTVSTNESYAIEDNAEAIAEVFFERRAEFAPALVPCLPSDYRDADIDRCIDGFIDEFGSRAFRRPLTEGETAIMSQLYTDVRETDGAEAGLTAIVHFVLQAPSLLYMAEPSGVAGEGLVPLSPDELASRLALLFTNSLPDEELRAAVRDGRLVTRDDVEREARRLVDSPEAVRAFGQFHHEWLRGFEVEDSEREHELFSEPVREALVQEMQHFSAWFLAETDGSFQTLMTTPAFPIDEALAPIYDTGGTRHGLITTAAAMASLAYSDHTSLVGRGVFIRDHVMCLPAPPFPGDIDIEGTLGGFGDLPTARQRLEPLMTNPGCAGCHTAINPLGFPFEVYDWTGAYRTTENDAPIDTSLEIHVGDLSGTFVDAGALLDALAATDDARDCYATHWVRYALGRPESPPDACVLEEIQLAFAESNGDVRELLVAIAVSDAFRFHKVEDAR